MTEFLGFGVGPSRCPKHVQIKLIVVGIWAARVRLFESGALCAWVGVLRFRV